MPAYRLYVDESGDHVFRDDVALGNPAHRYLALIGCMFHLVDDYIAFAQGLEQLKARLFPYSPDAPFVLHRDDVINRRGPFSVLREARANEAFEEALVRLVEQSRFHLFAVVIDKLAMKAQYPVPWHPYHAALGFMLQRYCGLLAHRGQAGDVVGETRGKREDGLLRNAYEHLLTHGDMFHRAAWYQATLTSGKLKLKEKRRNTAGLQLADVLAHPVKQQVLVVNGRIPSVKESFGARLAAVAESKLNRRSGDGRIEGYGRVLFPK